MDSQSDNRTSINILVLLQVHTVKNQTMKLKSQSNSSPSFVVFFCTLVILFSFIALSEMATLGGIRDSPAGSENNLETEALGRFAVDDHNQKQNGVLEFVRVVKAKEQVVAGTLHHLVVEAIDGGKKKLYEAKVWVKPWLNFKQVQEFRHAGDPETVSGTPSFTSSDLGVKQGGHAPGWQDVHPRDPQVQDAANHAVKSLQQKSNSLFPYELQEVVHAKAEVMEEHVKFNMLLKLKRGDKEEKYKVEVHKNNEGAYNLNQMEVEH